MRREEILRFPSAQENKGKETYAGQVKKKNPIMSNEPSDLKLVTLLIRSKLSVSFILESLVPAWLPNQHPRWVEGRVNYLRAPGVLREHQQVKKTHRREDSEVTRTTRNSERNIGRRLRLEAGQNACRKDRKGRDVPSSCKKGWHHFDRLPIGKRKKIIVWGIRKSPS